MNRPPIKASRDAALSSAVFAEEFMINRNYRVGISVTPTSEEAAAGEDGNILTGHPGVLFERNLLAFETAFRTRTLVKIDRPAIKPVARLEGWA